MPFLHNQFSEWDRIKFVMEENMDKLQNVFCVTKAHNVIDRLVRVRNDQLFCSFSRFEKEYQQISSTLPVWIFSVNEGGGKQGLNCLKKKKNPL